jgi:hypothetical protein
MFALPRGCFDALLDLLAALGIAVTSKIAVFQVRRSHLPSLVPRDPIPWRAVLLERAEGQGVTGIIGGEGISWSIGQSADLVYDFTCKLLIFFIYYTICEVLV